MNKKQKEKLMVIDGNSLIHRAFYALPLLSTKDGIYTNGVYGFLTMLYRIREEYHTDYICVAFDKKGPTFRHETFDLYKANRDSTPNELAQQFPIIREVLSAMDIAQLELDGYEADDIAGTLAQLGEDKGMEVILVTGDRDYLQLASDNTKVLITKKGITELDEYDREKVIEEYGISPEQLIDLKGLMGDKSDNIPGVPGIGEKTGIKLLKQFGTMENLYDNIDKVGGKKTRESLIEHKNMAILSKTLGKIIRNAPINITIDQLRAGKPDWDKLKELYTSLEFNSLLSKLPEDEVELEEPNYKTEYIILEGNNFKAVIEAIKEEKAFYFKFLFEDDNYIKSPILGIGIKVGDNTPYYIDFSQNRVDIFKDEFKKYFESEDMKKYGHMVKMDIFALLHLNIDISNLAFDSVIGQYLLNPAQTDYSINALGKEYLNIYGIDKESLLGKGKNKKAIKIFQ